MIQLWPQCIWGHIVLPFLSCTLLFHRVSATAHLECGTEYSGRTSSYCMACGQNWGKACGEVRIPLFPFAHCTTSHTQLHMKQREKPISGPIWCNNKIMLMCFFGGLKPLGDICNLWGNPFLKGILIIFISINST
jgi:hypothetical protein